MKTSMLTVGHEYQFYSTPRSTKFYEYATNWDYNITFLDEIARQADHEKSGYRQNKCAN